MHAHGEDLRVESGDDEWTARVVRDWRTAPLTAADRALCSYAETLTSSPGLMAEADVVALCDAGFDDRAIHDATQVVAYFNYINRIADGLGTDLEPEMPERPPSFFPHPHPLPPLDGDLEPSLVAVTRPMLSRILRMPVSEYQQRFVASNAVSLAQAHYQPKLVPRAIVVAGEPVGFVMTEPREDEVYVVRFLIDVRAQGLGIGTRAMLLLLDEARAAGIRRVTLSYVPALGSPEPFYRRLGFTPTGTIDEGEVEMEWLVPARAT